jgi:Domain of unknown function (DUF4126)
MNMLSGLPWGLAMVSGVNTYLPLFILALFARFSHVVQISSRFQFLTSDQALVILGALAACEILAQKFPGLDNVWDFVHTLLRPLAGAIVAGATLTTHSAFEMMAGMLLGATISTAAHAAKTTFRLATTTKSLGTANTLVSFVEDGAVVAGSLLSLFQPWVMFVFVVIFGMIFLWLGAWLFRTVMFDLRVTAAWLHWVGRRMTRRKLAQDLSESLQQFTPEQLERLKDLLEPGEEMLGALGGWKRSRRGQLPAWIVVTKNRVVLIERRRVRKHKVQSVAWNEIALALHRNLWLFERIELVTKQNGNIGFNLRKTHGRLGMLAVERIRQLAGIAPAGEPASTQTAGATADMPVPALPR